MTSTTVSTIPNYKRGWRHALRAGMATSCLVSALVAGLAGTADAADKIKIAQSIPTLNNPWYASFAKGSKDMAAALGVDLTLVTNPASTPFAPSAQINAIENLIARQPKVIQIDPTSTDGINTAIEEARNQGIKVVTDGINVSTDVDASVIADNKQGGELAGAYVAKALSGGGSVAMLQGPPGRDIITMRHDGFRQGLSANPQAKIVASQNADLDRSKGQTVTENVLEAHQDLKAIWGASDTMALGALEALKARNLAGKVLLGGFDGTPDAFQAIKDGQMSFTIDQVPYEMGATAIALSYKLATGQAPAEPHTVLETTLVDKSNVAAYLDQSADREKKTLAAVLAKYQLKAQSE
ncbi:sugar ABC transporter substrate-binding protein [Neorhizobium sp. NCHU2750]|uniref:sugar ABC transporter substrate-binding protein n=1 Tax=Neorhizobium sp. NCHU2750 TaxID=1825976 RepID=UPI000E75A2FD|nr:ribose ABC transporter substrate-binding protein [Neorhizobium sp. NCHU2750]